MGISLKRPADMSFQITCHRYSARRRNEIAVLAIWPTNKRRAFARGRKLGGSRGCRMPVPGWGWGKGFEDCLNRFGAP